MFKDQRTADNLFYLACEQGDLEEVKKLIIREQIYIQDVGTQGVILSSIKGNLKIIKFLIEVMNVKIAYPISNLSALSEAARNGHFEVVKYLVSKGASVTERDSAPFRWAMVKRHYHIGMYLFNQGSIPDSEHLARLFNFI
jgi:hypothetical protein